MTESTEIKIASQFQTTCQGAKIALDHPEKSTRHKEVGQWGGALTINRGGTKEIIRLNFNVSKLRQEIAGIKYTTFAVPINNNGKV